MRTEQVNLRLEADLIAALEKAAREEALDRGTLIRKLLLEALGQRRLERALQRCQRGEISIGRAAEETGLTHWDLLDLARDRGIAYPLTPDEAETHLGRLVGRASRVATRTRTHGDGGPTAPKVTDTLPDRPPARGAVLLVGINPAPVSVRPGHYFQGRLGKRLWQRLARLGLLADATPGREDEAFVATGNGLTDVVKRPTRSAKELRRDELRVGVEALRAKVRSWSPRLIVFPFRLAAQVALGSRKVSPGPCAPFEGVPTFLLSGPYASRAEADRVDAELIARLRAGGTERERRSLTRPVTPTDIANGRIRLPRDAKDLFPSTRSKLDVVLRGQRLGASYDPRRGPDKERAAVLRVGREALSRLVQPRESLRIQIGADGLVRLD